MLRIDTVELNDVLGLRFNVWTSIVLFVVARGVLRRSARRLPPGPGGADAVRRGARPRGPTDAHRRRAADGRPHAVRASGSPRSGARDSVVA